MKPTLYLINGPLGAGKTTFLRHLLKQPDFTNARVIENEFASTSVDTEQLHDHQAEVQTIAGICICCSTGDELTDALQLLAKSNEPVVIEATGVANSLKLIEKIVIADMLELYDVRHAVFVLDAVEAHANMQATIDIYKNELQAADTVLISKTDLLTTDEVDVLMESLSKLALSAVSYVHEGVFDLTLLDRESHILEYFAGLDEHIDNHDGNANYTIVAMADMPVDTELLEGSWVTLRDAYGLRRLKGNIKDIHGNLWHVEATPGQCKITPYVSGDIQLVLIGSNAVAINARILKDALNG